MSIGQHDHLTRQLDLIPVDTLGLHVNIIGCGAIGSFTALTLAKMGLTNIHAWDFDDVSVENMSNQFFRFSDIGKPKSLALMQLVESFTRTKIAAFNAAFEPHHAANLKGIVIAAVDSMDVRKMIFDSIKEQGFNVKLLIDPRMGAEFYSQYAINPFNDKDTEMYAKTLYSNDEAVQERCTAKSTVYTATLAAGLITKTIKNHMLKEDYPRNIQWDIKASNNPMQMYAGNAQAPSMNQTTAGYAQTQAATYTISASVAQRQV